MKWLIVISRFLPENFGGTYTYVDQFSKALIARGDEVHIVTTTRRTDLPQKEVNEGLTVHRVYVERGNMGPYYFNYTQRVTAYINQLDREKKFDYINPHGAFMVNTSNVRNTLKVVYTLHAVVTYEYLFSLKKIIYKQFFSKETFKALLMATVKLPLSYCREFLAVKNADKIIVMSNYVRGTIKTYLPGINLDKVFISRIGIDEKFCTLYDKKQLVSELEVKNKVSFLTVRRLESRMGIDNLITAFSILKKANKLDGVKLYIAGKGSLDNYFNKLIKNYTLEDHIELLGFVSDIALRKWYQICDAFIMPTEQLEGFGIVTIEAFASNLPVIATPAGANPEVAGLFCPELMTKSATCPQAIANSIKYYLENKDSYQERNYAERAKQIFYWPDIVEEIVAQLAGNH
ncbi:glycosyltransferase family 4 protein [Vibrio cholerae]|uniref:glycosyltransferase family 4 protein n=2 Tax=Vibrio cholerae TaxID=666 RepID=UPI0004E2D0B6|nr:glycosyltransferase family 4 protein [Vibrio cholerae]EGQ9844164.1 glycosyltransferase family 4 protein [Vibrio cholerae]EGR1090926.1 glycosyltransferase family 1 protein [Vibrio cholerae]KFE22629.1 glycosyl transferases group 1 family protein [Vibrio cholerae]TXZ30836.1 glycosyltransferase family 4 protein [Vibrio cholerae]BCK28817.1 GDP-mannose-dependent alpha-(1-6)-phosphatidylinositol monomannoside mannosyltransferase [Vibrio cholerae]